MPSAAGQLRGVGQLHRQASANDRSGGQQALIRATRTQQLALPRRFVPHTTPQTKRKITSADLLTPSVWMCVCVCVCLV